MCTIVGHGRYGRRCNGSGHVRHARGRSARIDFRRQSLVWFCFLETLEGTYAQNYLVCCGEFAAIRV